MASRTNQPALSPEQRAAALEALSNAIAAKRKEAVDGRLNSGIEDDWREDEDFYNGIDDANRHEVARERRKPTEQGASSQTDKPTGCILFPNITAPYVDAAAAKVGDMLLPTDDRNFVIEPTPIPDILDEGEGWPAATSDQPLAPTPQTLAGAMPQQQPQTPAAALMGNPAAAAGAPADPIGDALKKIEAIRVKALQAAKAAEAQVDDFLTECQYHAELRHAIDDAARIGSGVLKGPFPVKRKTRMWARDPKSGERVLVIKQETKPASKRVDPWNLFPDPACGQNIHDGGYIFERDFLTPKKLRDLKGGEGKARYIDSAIDQCLAEGPAKRNTTNYGSYQTEELSNKDVFEVWYFYGTISGQDLVAAGCECEDESAQFPVLVTVVNDRVIKAALNPLESGEFPYDLLPWKRRKGLPWGVGVARQGRTAQRTYTAAFRNLMDNAGAASRPHKVITDAITQGPDPWTWIADSEANVGDVRAAMTFFVQPSLQQEMIAITQLAERMMELHTGLPLITLGMQGNIQETAAGRALQNNNGSAVLRRIARLFDSCITEPHISRYYAWLMEYSEDETVKGDFTIKARGSSALVERDIQNQQLPTVLNLALNPAFELDPKLAVQEYLKSQRLTVKNFELTDKRKAELAERAKASQQQPYQVAVAQMREQGETQRAQMALQDKAAARQQDAHENELDRQVEKMQIEVDAQLGAAALSMEERSALNDIKATLAGITMKLQTQRQLSALRGPQVMKPPTEPAGRAAPGMAFAQ